MPGGGRLDIRVGTIDVLAPHDGLAPGRYVSLAVRDDGAGMDEETRRRATEPFFSTKGLGAGTGLGLSMVHGLAGQLGGALRIDSEVGQGTTVALILPASDRQAPPAMRSDDGDDILPPLAVLLVDDEPLVRASTAAMLEGLGHRVTACGSGAEALALVDGGRTPDLLVTDQVMPSMPGDRLAAAIRDRHPVVLTLLVSGFRGAAEPDPATGWLAKPFRAAELDQAIRRLRGQAEHAGPPTVQR